jgi:hypothetical protein
MDFLLFINRPQLYDIVVIFLGLSAHNKSYLQWLGEV